MRALYPPDLASEALDPTTWYNLVGAAGCLFWVLAYLFILKQSRKDEAHGLPMVAICLNFAWEFLASFVFPNPVWLWHTFDRAWLAIDVLILGQLLRYGRPLQTEPELRRWFFPIVALTIVAAGVGQYLFVLDYRDRLGLIVAFIINLVMSVTFISMYFVRRRHGMRGISAGAAWCKMLGTLGTSIECHWVVRAIDPELPDLGFLTFLSVSILAVDAIYVALVSRAASAEEPSAR